MDLANPGMQLPANIQLNIPPGPSNNTSSIPLAAFNGLVDSFQNREFNIASMISPSMVRPMLPTFTPPPPNVLLSPNQTMSPFPHPPLMFQKIFMNSLPTSPPAVPIRQQINQFIPAYLPPLQSSSNKRSLTKNTRVSSGLSPPKRTRRSYPKTHSQSGSKIFNDDVSYFSKHVAEIFDWQGQKPMIHLFLLKLLSNEHCRHVIEWFNKEERVFKVIIPSVVAKLWKHIKGNKTDNYECFARGIRHSRDIGKYFEAHDYRKKKIYKFSQKALQDFEANKEPISLHLSEDAVEVVERLHLDLLDASVNSTALKAKPRNRLEHRVITAMSCPASPSVVKNTGTLNLSHSSQKSKQRNPNSCSSDSSSDSNEFDGRLVIVDEYTTPAVDLVITIDDDAASDDKSNDQ